MATSPVTFAAAPSTTLSTAPAPVSLSPKEMEKIKETAKQFEAVFISEMMNHMFEGVSADPMFGGGGGEDMFHSMLVNEYGKQIADSHSIGITDQMQKVMIELQQQSKE